MTYGLEGGWFSCQLTVDHKGGGARRPAWSFGEALAVIYGSEQESWHSMLNSHWNTFADLVTDQWSVKAAHCRLQSYSAAVLPGSSWVNWCNRYGYSWHLPRFHKNDKLNPPPCPSFRCQERFSCMLWNMDWSQQRWSMKYLQPAFERLFD